MTYLTDVYFGNTISQYLIFFGILAGSFLIAKLGLLISVSVVRRIASKTKTMADDIFIDSIERPATFLVIIIGFYIGFHYLILSDDALLTFTNVTKMLVTIAVGWFFVKFIDQLIEHYVQPMAAKTDTDLDDHLVPFMRKVLKFLTVALTIVIVLDNAGYDIGTLLAGLGIGGLAFALAAKDLIANIFGGITIILDKPFAIGDRIRVGKYDGKIEEIGMRSTKIRTLDGTQVIVPNSNITNDYVENVQREPFRRVKITLGVEYGTTSAKLQKAKKIVLDILHKHKNVADKEKEPKVAFTAFGPSSLDIFVSYYMRDSSLYFETLDDVNSDIKKQFEKAKIEFAFPTQTIHLKK